MLVRLMIPDDIEILAAWIPSVPLWQRYHATAENVRGLLTRALEQGDLLLVADLPAHPAIGYALVVRDGAFNRSPYLRLIGVHPDQSGAGVGSALLTQAEAEVRPNSREMFLLVSDFNTDAQRFYQRHGYEQVGAIPGYVVPDVAELLFWKRLN
jgi:ribosomal protein S18 acetylase RimI-like enzyme